MQNDRPKCKLRVASHANRPVWVIYFQTKKSSSPLSFSRTPHANGILLVI